jgi:hypothetical protein
MSPHGSPKEARFIFVMDEQEKQRLETLAKSDERSAAAWLRAMINREYVQKFGDKPPKKKK